jgi:hypothetical protein
MFGRARWVNIFWRFSRVTTAAIDNHGLPIHSWCKLMISGFFFSLAKKYS